MSKISFVPLDEIDTSMSENGIVTMPGNADPFFQIFAKCTHVLAGNGDRIHIVAQAGVTDEQMVHAKNILSAYLTDIPGTQYGSDKAPVSNKIAAAKAILLLFTDDETLEKHKKEIERRKINYQDLQGSEMLPGNTSLDAAYEEIAHLVHRYGINRAIPEMQVELEIALRNALERNLYVPLHDIPRSHWVYEYLAVGLETYYGLWAHNPHGDGKAGGAEYAFITRAAMKSGDPQLSAIIEGFFPKSKPDDILCSSSCDEYAVK